MIDLDYLIIILIHNTRIVDKSKTTNFRFKFERIILGKYKYLQVRKVKNSDIFTIHTKQPILSESPGIITDLI